MNTSLRLLAVDDCEDDVDLIVYALRRGGFEPFWRRVDSAETLRAALLGESWDVVTCDFVMPSFGALPALEIIRVLAPETPAIVVSGEVGEEFAVTAMRAGAHDFVSKHRLSRLAPAIARDLREADARRARRRAEAAQRASEEQFRLLFENSLDAILISDDQGNYRNANRAACELFGLSRERFLRMNAADLATLGSGEGETPERFLDYRQSAYRMGELGFARPDGERRVAEYAACEFAPGLHLCILRDQTARRRAEEALRRSEAHWRTFIAEATDPIFTLDATGRVTSLNRRVSEVTGYAAEELLGHSPLELVAPTRLSEAAQALGTVLAGGAVDSAEVDIVAKDGRAVKLEVRGRTIREDDRVVETFHIARDITDRTRTERRLAMVLTINRVLVSAETAEARVAGVLRAVCEAGEWELGEWWSLRGGLSHHREGVWGSDADAAGAPAGSDLTLGPEEGLPGRVLAARAPVWVADLAAGDQLARPALGLRSAVGFPISDAGEMLGSLLFFQRAPRAPDEAFLAVCATLGAVIGRFVSVQDRSPSHGPALRATG